MRQRWLAACLASLLVGWACLGSLQAQAPSVGAGTAGDQGHGADAAGPNDLGKMFGMSLDLAIWTWVVFIILFIVLRKYAWKPMLEGLQRREENIHEALALAQRNRQEAQGMRDQLQAQMNQAQDKVREMLDEARRDAQHTTEDMIAKARSEIQTERERHRREIELARDQALQQLWAQTAQLAAQVSSKAIRRQLTADDHRRLVDEAIAELRQPGDRLHEAVGV